LQPHLPDQTRQLDNGVGGQVACSLRRTRVDYRSC
jgi:hypothetical protein